MLNEQMELNGSTQEANVQQISLTNVLAAVGRLESAGEAQRLSVSAWAES
jgi:hypothetical protein